MRRDFQLHLIETVPQIIQHSKAFWYNIVLIYNTFLKIPEGLFL